MARVFSADITHKIVPETVFGTTPTASATMSELPLSTDQNLLVAEATSIKSNTKRPNNAGNGSQRGMRAVSGALNMRGYYGVVPNMLMEGLLRSAFASKVLKAGTTDKSFSIIHKLASDQVKTNVGCVVKGLTIDAKANDVVNFDFDVMGIDQIVGATDNALAVVPTAYVGPGEYEGSDVVSINVAGQTVSFSELSFQITADRTQSPVLGSTTGLAFGYNGAREIKVTIKAYRDSLALDQNLTGLAQAFSFNLGTTGAGWSFSCPTMFFDIPKDEQNNGSAYVTITGTAGYDNTAASDVVITQL
ncbi:phage tail tube protein [Sphingomonas sp. Leaf34]|uniref:phage tail tube protein n=1 Tax=Sphingomonas sp. Leaf34 TaxID=1736216 RepID=UPI000A580D1C|nr:phage tail tube protein [Sphingomonas sp. Leaf34]